MKRHSDIEALAELRMSLDRAWLAVHKRRERLAEHHANYRRLLLAELRREGPKERGNGK